MQQLAEGVTATRQARDPAVETLDLADETGVEPAVVGGLATAWALTIAVTSIGSGIGRLAPVALVVTTVGAVALVLLARVGTAPVPSP